MTPFDSPRLIADIGGTWARFALETAAGRFEQQLQRLRGVHVVVSAQTVTTMC